MDSRLTFSRTTGRTWLKRSQTMSSDRPLHLGLCLRMYCRCYNGARLLLFDFPELNHSKFQRQLHAMGRWPVNFLAIVCRDSVKLMHMCDSVAPFNRFTRP